MYNPYNTGSGAIDTGTKGILDILKAYGQMNNQQMQGGTAGMVPPDAQAPMMAQQPMQPMQAQGAGKSGGGFCGGKGAGGGPAESGGSGGGMA